MGCKHEWRPHGGAEFEFVSGSSHSEPVAHVTCSICGGRTFLTESQLGMPIETAIEGAEPEEIATPVAEYDGLTIDEEISEG